jgi:hypothetical protein
MRITHCLSSRISRLHRLKQLGPGLWMGQVKSCSVLQGAEDWCKHVLFIASKTPITAVREQSASSTPHFARATQNIVRWRCFTIPRPPFIWAASEHQTTAFGRNRISMARRAVNHLNRSPRSESGGLPLTRISRGFKSMSCSGLG